MRNNPSIPWFAMPSRMAFLIGIPIVAIVLISAIIQKSPPSNLLESQHWQYFAGATTTKDGLHIQPLGRIITHQDGSLGQPNPPVNLAGSHLSLSGDFSVTAEMKDIDVRGVLRLYGRPPIVYDQWRFETGSIGVDVGTSTILVRIWDGTSSNAIDMRMYPYTLKSTAIISIAHRGDSLVVSADSQELGTIPDHDIFDTKEVWFGVDAADGDEWTLSSLSIDGRAEITPPPSFDENNDDANALRNLAATHPRKISIGTAIAYEMLVTDKKYRELALGEFGIFTPENGMKPQFIHPLPDVYVFSEMDALVNIAEKNDILIHGHTLVYSKSSPEWMVKAPLAARQQIMLEHIDTVASHFKGKVAQWDVVNEPLSNKKAPYRKGGNGLEENIWYEAMGEQYIDKAFHAARLADPSADLYLNDYGLERDGERWDALLALIKRLKGRGVPIDGIGFESHVYGDGDYTEASVLKAHMRTLALLGLKVRISEIDVTGDDAKEQINQYVTALDVCLRAPNCTSYSTWGITDAYGSTTRSDRYPLVYGTSLLFDTELKAKSAYSALQERLRLPY